MAFKKPLYRPNNNGNTRDLFDQRLNYLEYMDSVTSPVVYNFNFGEDIYYGRVRYDMTPVVVRESLLAPFKAGNNIQQSFVAVNFVRDIFDEMSRQFDKAALLGKINPDDKYLTSLRVYRAYESPYQQYEKHQLLYFKNFRDYVLATKRYFTNVTEFMDILMEYLKFTVRSVKFTFPAFIKSTNCTVLNSGLAIEIADLSYTNDAEKIKQFLQSPNWEYYVNACNSYGFRIDQDAPWRLVMDIAADDVRKISSRYGMPTVISLQSKGYRSASMMALTSFGKLLYNLYVFCTKKTFSLTEYCGNDIIRKTIDPQSYSIADFQEALPTTSLVQYYLHLRLMEEKTNLTKEARQHIVDDVMQICLSKNSFTPVGLFFESVINKEFDKMGSLQYYYERQQNQLGDSDFAEHIEDAKANEGQISTFYEPSIKPE